MTALCARSVTRPTVPTTRARPPSSASTTNLIAYDRLCEQATDDAVQAVGAFIRHAEVDVESATRGWRTGPSCRLSGIWAPGAARAEPGTPTRSSSSGRAR